MKLFVKILLGAICLGSVFAYSHYVDASQETNSIYVSNTAALDDVGPFFMVCSKIEETGECKLVCPNCGQVYKSEGTYRGNYGGICVKCGYFIPYLNP